MPPIQVNKFPNMQERQRVTDLLKYKRLGELKHKAVLPLHEKVLRQFKNEREAIYISHAIPARISEFYGDFVQGDEDKLIISASDSASDEYITETVTENDLIEKIYDMGVEQSEYGYFVLHVRKNADDIVNIDLVPQDQYFPQKDGSVIIATYTSVKSSFGDALYCFTQHYAVDGIVKIERKLWKCDNFGVVTEELPYTSLKGIFGFDRDEQESIEVDELPFVLVPNGRAIKGGFGRSDYYSIMPNLAQINERTTAMVAEFIKNLNAKTIIPDSKQLFDDDGNVKEWDTLVVEGRDNITPQFLTNNNPLMDNVMEFIMFELKTISFVSAVPMNELLKTNMPERVEAMRIQLYGAMRKTSTKRAKVKRGLKDALRIGAKLKGIKMETDPVISMSDALPTDDATVVDIEVAKVTSGLSSKVSSIMRLENISEEKAIEEIQKIDNEANISGFGVNN